MISYLKPAKAGQQIADSVRSSIVSGELRVGDRLPSEKELIRLTGYSRAVVREGLRILEADGLIALPSGRKGGAVIERPTPARLASTIEVLLSFESIDVKEINEVLYSLDTLAVELAIDRSSKEDIQELRKTIDIIREDPEDLERVSIESNRFHILLADATRNRMLALLSRIVRHLIIRADYEPSEISALQIARAHERILDAIEAKDVESARRRAVRHLSACCESLSQSASGDTVKLTTGNTKRAEALAQTSPTKQRHH